MTLPFLLILAVCICHFDILMTCILRSGGNVITISKTSTYEDFRYFSFSFHIFGCIKN